MHDGIDHTQTSQRFFWKVCMFYTVWKRIFSKMEFSEKLDFELWKVILPQLKWKSKGIEDECNFLSHQQSMYQRHSNARLHAIWRQEFAENDVFDFSPKITFFSKNPFWMTIFQNLLQVFHKNAIFPKILFMVRL